MRKLHVRIARLIPPLICLGIALCLVTMAAPGFAFFGHKYVDLVYDGDMTIKGKYPSIWRLRFNRLTISEVDFRDVKFRGSPSRPRLRHKPRPLDEDYPLAITLRGVTYNLGEITPDLFRSLGGQVHELPTGQMSGTLQIGPGSKPAAGYLYASFSDGRPVSFGFSVSRSVSKPLDVGFSFRGGPTLRLPASEGEIIKAFGPPQNREERIVPPGSRGRPLQTAGSFRFSVDSAGAPIQPPSPASPLTIQTPASG